MNLKKKDDCDHYGAREMNSDSVKVGFLRMIVLCKVLCDGCFCYCEGLQNLSLE